MANRLAGFIVMIGASVAPMTLRAQADSTVRAAVAAYDHDDFTLALSTAKRAVRQRLSQQHLATAYEIMAFTYASLDSTRQAVQAFRSLIFLDPDRQPDVRRVSPKITSLYALALSQELVVRGLRADSASFIGGQGGVPIEFSVSRAARVSTRLVAEGLDVVVDSQLVAGVGGFRWAALTAGGEPLPAGRYRMVVTASEGSSSYARELRVEVRHSAVDTLPHLTALPGYSTLPETEVPPRDWKPVGATFLYAGLSTGAAFALSSNDLGTSWRAPVIGVSIATLAVGIAMTVKRPDARAVPANIRYNQLLAEQLVQRNADIAAQNATRRRQTLLTVVGAAAPTGRAP